MAAWTAIDESEAYFAATLYTGNSTSRTITTGMQSDLIWIKQRNTVRPNVIFDTVNTSSFASGNSKYLVANTDGALTSNNSTQLTGVTSTGFTMGADNSDQINHTGSTAVAWTWKANGSGSSNTDGSLSATVSANATAGFSIGKYTGWVRGTDSKTIGHGLGATPKMILVKALEDTEDWRVFHAGNTAAPETDYLVLNTAVATADDATAWNDTAPTSTVWTVGGGGEVSEAGEDYIAYCFADVQGFSKFGSYVGNGDADGPMVFTGFRPSFILGKNTGTADNHWFIVDAARSPYNGDSKWLKVDSAAAELTNLVNPDFLSNGFKIRSSDDIYNDSGETFIYAAFAEAPLVNSGGVPGNAK